MRMATRCDSYLIRGVYRINFKNKKEYPNYFMGDGRLLVINNITTLRIEGLLS